MPAPELAPSPSPAALPELPEEDLALLLDGAKVVAEAWIAGLEREPRLTVSEWADRHRVLLQDTSAEPGPYRTDRTPYLRAIMDCLSASVPVERVVFMKGAQIGATEAGNNWVGYIIQHAPGPMLYLEPTVDVARKASKQRISPMLENTPSLATLVSEPKSKHAENTILTKDYPGGTLTIGGANSAAGLRHIPVRYLFADEVDGYPADVDDEGDPLSLAIKRTATFSGTRKIFMVSTPTTRGVSRIEKEFEASDKCYYEVPCPHCGVYQPITWAQIKFPHDRPAEAHLECRDCEEPIAEAHKGQMLAEGRWTPTAEGDGRTRGFHINALYSPPGWYSWAEAATDFLKAKAEGRESLKVWVNTVLGETWEEDGETLEDDTLLARTERYPARVPREVLTLTCGVDVQDNRVEYEVVGWGAGEETWGIEYGRIWGDPGKTELWDQLQATLDRQWAHEDGSELGIAATCIDSGGHYTQQVYRFCKGKQARRIFAIKGMAGEGRPIVASPQKKRTGRTQRHLELFLVGVDQARGLVHSRLRLTHPGAGYCHFPSGQGYDLEYFRQLTSMKVVIRYHKGIGRREWLLIQGRRKEAFDCRVYALAACYILNPIWDALAKRRGRRPVPAPAPQREEPRDPEPTQPTRRGKISRRRGGWVSGWKH